MKLFTRRPRMSPGPTTSPASRLERVASKAFIAAAWTVLLFLLAPVLIIVVESFDTSNYLSFPPKGLTLKWYESVLGDASWRAAFLTSLRISTIAAVLATVLGGMAAWALARVRWRGKGLLLTFMVSPMIVPVIVMALAYYFGLAPLGLIGHESAIAVVYAVMGIPMVIIILQGALEHFNPDLEKAARTLGAGPLRTLRHVTIPQLASAVMAGAVFAFVLAFDEAVVILFVSGSSAVTVPRKLWDSVRYDLDPSLAAVGTLLIAATVLLLTISELLDLVRRRRRAQ